MAWMMDMAPLVLAGAVAALMTLSVLRQARKPQPVPVRVRNRRAVRR
ncbi:hypothetical protein [Novispirillum itersonii]|uniref:Uncharacterized protein n=1 Tax=Novispirillum itersonii TaxID=189 RepID=A0A7W9ZDC5_NOVIT|nr:hypothetical protein [Novispirillum itersonii]MBB6209113.1 hypothetical protein [Novispirillum itersonii]